MASQHLKPADLDRLVAEAWIDRVEFHEECESTNNLAMDLARKGEVGPLVVLAERQTAGRGRGGKSWWSGSSGLTFSLLTAPMASVASDSARLSLAVGVALCEALEPFAGEQPVQLKWPNDIMVRGRKLAGILIEVPPGSPPRAVIGVGLNVGPLDQAPPEVQAKAISLSELEWEPDRVLLLEKLLKRLGQVLRELGTDPVNLADRWRHYSFLDGRHVEIELPGGGRVEGLAQSIDDQGALLVATAKGEERCRSGIVTGWGEAALGG
jgi:BirA family transcriptional regulator, biotin operon repressor / biotin---[acetyl-CoA-carboxylase] ligase